MNSMESFDIEAPFPHNVAKSSWPVNQFTLHTSRETSDITNHDNSKED